MICCVCQKLHVEGRIPTALPARMLIAGYSVCIKHADIIPIESADPMHIAVEAERRKLIDWWQMALDLHGEWMHTQQRFEDGSTLHSLNFPLLPKPIQ